LDFDFLKELYFHELDRRDRLDQAPTLRVAVLALGAGLFTYYLDLYALGDDILGGIFLFAGCGAIVSGLLTIIWIIRSYLGYTYSFLPYASQLEKYWRDLQRYRREYQLEEDASRLLFQEALEERLVEAVTHNSFNNNSRSELLYGASRFLAAFVVFALLAGLPVVAGGVARMTTQWNGGDTVTVGFEEVEND